VAEAGAGAGAGALNGHDVAAGGVTGTDGQRDDFQEIVWRSKRGQARQHGRDHSEHHDRGMPASDRRPPIR
jgi:hypothetical protein